jgi:hypothetical protein
MFAGRPSAATAPQRAHCVLPDALPTQDSGRGSSLTVPMPSLTQRLRNATSQAKYDQLAVRPHEHFAIGDGRNQE